MRTLLILIIFIGFPLTELLILFKLASDYGWWLGIYLLATAIVGWALIREEKSAALVRLFQNVQNGLSPMTALLTSAHRLIAGILFIIPGVLSDVMAILILIASVAIRPPPRKTLDDVIEGEWRRED